MILTSIRTIVDDSLGPVSPFPVSLIS